jgi:FtsH-binding integral membrane protein
MPHADVIYAVLGLVVFGGYTVLDFNRLRRADNGEVVQIAAGIFLDVINVFLFFLQLFGGRD